MKLVGVLLGAAALVGGIYAAGYVRGKKKAQAEFDDEWDEDLEGCDCGDPDDEWRKVEKATDVKSTMNDAMEESICNRCDCCDICGMHARESVEIEKDFDECLKEAAVLDNAESTPVEEDSGVFEETLPEEYDEESYDEVYDDDFLEEDFEKCEKCDCDACACGECNHKACEREEAGDANVTKEATVEEAKADTKSKRKRK